MILLLVCIQMCKHIDSKCSCVCFIVCVYVGVLRLQVRPVEPDFNVGKAILLFFTVGTLM